MHSQFSDGQEKTGSIMVATCRMYGQDFASESDHNAYAGSDKHADAQTDKQDVGRKQQRIVHEDDDNVRGSDVQPLHTGHGRRRG